VTDGTWEVLPLQTATAGRLLDDGMALFDGLADRPRPVLRWYRSTRPAIVLGRGQGALDVRPDGVEIVTRFSGGGAVWLSPDVLSLDVLVPVGHPWVTDRLTDAFDEVGRIWADALTGLGVSDLAVHAGPSTARRRGTAREQLLAAVCYATLGRGEVLWHGRKLVGLAQRRRRHATLVQCGLLRRWRPYALLRSLGADPEDAQVLAAAVGLDEVCAEPPTNEAVMAAVTAACAAAVGAHAT
jgi:lipoate-protein ligase A